MNGSSFFLLKGPGPAQQTWPGSSAAQGLQDLSSFGVGATNMASIPKVSSQSRPQHRPPGPQVEKSM